MGARAELLDTLSIISLWQEPPETPQNSFSSITLFYHDSNKNFKINILIDSSINVQSKKEKESVTFFLFRTC